MHRCHRNRRRHLHPLISSLLVITFHLSLELSSFLILGVSATSTTSKPSTTNNDENNNDNSCQNNDSSCLRDDPSSPYSWPHLLTSTPTKPITSNGNIYPPTPSENKNDCLLLISTTVILRHCPNLNTHLPNATHDESSSKSDNTIVVFRDIEERFRGVFAAPNTERRRLWVLTTPFKNRGGVDELYEIDTVEKRIVQRLKIPVASDSHDIVRVKSNLFLVDTRGGNILQLALPASSPPYTTSSLSGGATLPQRPGYVDLIKIHSGFLLEDHINNVSVHDDMFVVSVHGGDNIRHGTVTRGDGTVVVPKTRVAGLARRDGGGRELEEGDGFKPLMGHGHWCHNLAFWKQGDEIKLLTLDSKDGSLIAITVVPPTYKRTILWKPDLTDPILTPPPGIPSLYSGSRVFAKGLAVQDDTAFLSLSFARMPNLRRDTPYSLLVGVDLLSKKELFVRPIRSGGLISQIVTESYVGYQLRGGEDVDVVLSQGELERTCRNDDGGRCREYESNPSLCRRRGGECCACGGGTRVILEHLGRPSRMINEEYYNIAKYLGDYAMFNKRYKNDAMMIIATVTFPQSTTTASGDGESRSTTANPQCLDDVSGSTKRLKLHQNDDNDDNNQRDTTAALSSVTSKVEDYVNRTIKLLCTLNVSHLQKFMSTYTRDNPEIFVTDDAATTTGGGGSTLFIIDGNDNDLKQQQETSHFNNFLPYLQRDILDPLGVTINDIRAMKFIRLRPGKSMTPTSKTNHERQIHIPIMTHYKIFFNLSYDTDEQNNRKQRRHVRRDLIRVRSWQGEAFEIDAGYGIWNLGDEDMIHLVIDYVDSANDYYYV